MKLLIDHGNTRVKLAVLADDGLMEPLFIGAVEQLHEVALPESVKEAWLATVGQSNYQAELLAWLAEQVGEVHKLVSEQSAYGVTSAYENFTTLGVDRWLTLVAAHSEQAKPTVIVDAGTAVTVDWLAADGQHLGGWIAPGVELMESAILAKARGVFHADDTAGRANHLGNSTPQALADGCVNTFIGLVKQAISVTETELDWNDYRLLFSGGSVPLLPADMKRRGEQRPDLVLQGIACYAQSAG